MATFGDGGYARAILDAAPCRVVALDRDPDARRRAGDLLQRYRDRLRLLVRRFGELEDALAALDLPTDAPVDASQMYARTVMAMIQEFGDEEGFHPDPEDEIFAGSCVTHGGRVVHERVRTLLSSN